MKTKFNYGHDPTSKARIEAKHKLVLPPDYCEYLERFNGGEYRQTAFHVPALKEDCSLARLFGVLPPGVGMGHNLEYLQVELGNEFYAEELYIGDEGCGNLILLNCSQETGGVYYYDRGVEHAQSKGRTLYLVAFTFRAFINGLKTGDDADWQQPLQWPDPVPKTNPKRWPPRKQAIWKPGEGPETWANNEILHPLIRPNTDDAK